MRRAIIPLAVVLSLLSVPSFALTQRDLNPQERAVYDLIKSDPQQVASFFATREYVRQSAAIVAAPQNKRIAMALKRPANFDLRYLLPGESATINSAVELSLLALAEAMWA